MKFLGGAEGSEVDFWALWVLLAYRHISRVC